MRAGSSVSNCKLGFWKSGKSGTLLKKNFFEFEDLQPEWLFFVLDIKPRGADYLTSRTQWDSLRKKRTVTDCKRLTVEREVGRESCVLKKHNA